MITQVYSTPSGTGGGVCNKIHAIRWGLLKCFKNDFFCFYK